MDKMYPAPDFYDASGRLVFNYTLPEDWYSTSQSRSNHGRNPYSNADSIPRMFVNPQHVVMSSPLSPALDDFSFPAGPHPTPTNMTMDERDHMSYSLSTPRKRPAQETWCQSQSQRSYTVERSSGRASRHAMPYQNNLPSPPSSPTSHIPASTIPYRPSSATSPRASLQTINPQITMNSRSGANPYQYPSSYSSSRPPPSYGAVATAIQSPSGQAPTVDLTTKTTSSQRSFCSHEDCTDPNTGKQSKSFSRRADLQRHEKTKHGVPELYSCPRPNCIRKGDNGFTRLDHLMEHRRGYHGEQLPKKVIRGTKKA